MKGVSDWENNSFDNTYRGSILRQVKCSELKKGIILPSLLWVLVNSCATVLILKLPPQYYITQILTFPVVKTHCILQLFQNLDSVIVFLWPLCVSCSASSAPQPMPFWLSHSLIFMSAWHFTYCWISYFIHVLKGWLLFPPNYTKKMAL